MLEDLCHLIWKLKPEQIRDLHSFIQVEYLHGLVLDQEKAKHVSYLIDKITEIKGKPVKLDEATQGTARFNRSKPFAIKTLHKLYHQFIIWEQLKKGDAFALETIKYYEDLDPEIALAQTKKLVHNLDKKPKKSTNAYELHADLIEQQYFNPLSPKSTLSDTLKHGVQQATIGYLIRVLRLELELLLHKRMFAQPESTALPSLLAPLEALVHLFSPLHPTILLYYQLIGLVQEPKASALDETLDLLKTSAVDLHLDDVSIIGNNLHTLINQEYEKSGDSAFQKRMFELYKLFYQHPEIFQSYLADPIFLSNVAVVAAQVGEAAWMFKVIERLIPTMPQGDQNVAIILAKVKWYLIERKFVEAEELLLNLSIFKLEPRIKISYFTCTIMLDLIRACDELVPLARGKYTNQAWLTVVRTKVASLDTKLEAFARALRDDNTLQNTRILSYKNFIKAVREIKNQLTKQEMNGASFEQLLQTTSTFLPLASKGWLLSLIRAQASKGYPGN